MTLSGSIFDLACRPTRRPASDALGGRSFTSSKLKRTPDRRILAETEPGLFTQPRP
ncbi:hypothetical protein [Streptomyces sp. NPDC051001]|uniref:hypothetical protein n=1 Tax=Streptomyces sp. NPDC051001 TaxID=3155795 RepID=UPI003448BD9D